jgi:NADH-quinone oxidoreductase subunit G
MKMANTKMVTLKIDDQTISVPEGTLVVNAAKEIGINIPVFCYHPKMEPVGMCRMCLVEVGRPAMDRMTNQPILQADGMPKIAFSPKLETACTTPVSEGMVVITQNQKVAGARREILEFILTSHPLDCPICDKGGECPLQNLTMGFGPGKSRFEYDEKMHLAKNVPLGELIFLDRERCIQCARCVRFQSEIVDDPVIGLTQRGRSFEIITHSNPGFDSYFSGNTTDICPVGALTTADFRFGARPWELKSAASICNHCPVGCNITFNVRREARSGGKTVIKRVMPRQNEEVNEIWICDKARFVYHYSESPERLSQPLVRRDGKLVEASWEEVLQKAADGLRSAAGNLTTLVGGRLSNEDLFNLKQLTDQQGGRAVLHSYMAGGDLTAQIGVGQGSNFAAMGKETAILVVASDLHEEAPVWWLRVKQAAQRGATLIVVNPRPTRLDHYASHVIRYSYGSEVDALANFLPGKDSVPENIRAAMIAFARAENAVVMYGSEGLGLKDSAALSRMAADLLVATQHTGRPNNGLLAVWPHGNTQGAWELGFRSTEQLVGQLSQSAAVYIAAADPAGDDPALAGAVERAGFVVVQELFLTETARLADVVLPAQAFTEREGTYTSGERRVQRFYQAVTGPALPQRPDFVITAQIAGKLGLTLESRAASLVMAQIAAHVQAFAGLNYAVLAEVKEQWPDVGRHDLYYGGTGYENKQGLGAQLTSAVERGETMKTGGALDSEKLVGDGLLVVPVARLYDRGTLLIPSKLLINRLAEAELRLNPSLAEQHALHIGEPVQISINGHAYTVQVSVDESIPDGAALLSRSTGIPIQSPVFVRVIR